MWTLEVSVGYFEVNFMADESLIHLNMAKTPGSMAINECVLDVTLERL